MKTVGFTIPETKVSRAFHCLLGPGTNGKITLVLGVTETPDKGIVFLITFRTRQWFVWNTFA